MLNLTANTLKVFLALDPCDMRKSFNALQQLAEDQLGAIPARDALFVFTNKRRTKAERFPKNLMILIEKEIIPEEVLANPEVLISTRWSCFRSGFGRIGTVNIHSEHGVNPAAIVPRAEFRY